MGIQEYINKAMSLITAGLGPKAIELLKEAIKEYPNSFKLHLFLGSILQTNLPSEALLHINKAILINPNEDLLYFYRGNIYKNLGNPVEALNNYSHAINMGLLEAGLYNNRGNIYKLLGKLDEALLDYNSAIKINPKDSNYYCNRGVIYRNKKKYVEALNDFTKALELDPYLPNIYMNRGTIFLDLEKYNDAVTEFDLSIKLDSNYSLAYLNRAIAYRKIKNVEKAFQDIVIYEELNNSIDEFIENSNEILNYFNTNNAPFLINRVIKKIYNIDTYLSFKSLIENNFKETSQILSVLETNQEIFTPKNKFQLLSGIVTYYLKDPSVCYKLFDNEIDINLPDDLIGQFYFILSCDDYIKSEKKAITANALNKAKSYVADSSNIEILQIYYAGHILFLNEEYKSALECFQKCTDFIPALCMQIVCYSILKDKIRKDKLIEELLLLDKHNEGLLQYNFIPRLSITNFEKSVMMFAHIREIEGVLPLINDYNLEKYDCIDKKYSTLFSQDIKIFTIDESTEEGEQTLVKIKLYKQSVIDEFCKKCELQFETKIKDRFLIWQNQHSNLELENLLASDISLILKKDIKKNYQVKIDRVFINNIIDYFTVKNKLSEEARYMLTFWTLLCEFKNRSLSETDKKAIKFAVSGAFKITIGYFGETYPVPMVISFLVEHFTKNYLAERLIQFVEFTLTKNDKPIPEFYSDFKLQFGEYLKADS